MSCLQPTMLVSGGKPLPVPCGKCPECRLARSQGWIFRLKQHLKKVEYDNCHFVTLTYDPAHIHLSGHNFATLVRSDLQKYFKILRADLVRAGKLCRIYYYAVGEYGGESGRPHYHAIIYGCPVEFITHAWRDFYGNPRGGVFIGTVNSSSIAYVTKYLCKPATVPMHRRDDRVREFSLMSKGLGANYLTPAMVKWHTDDLTRNYAWDDGKKIALPRYFRDRLFTESDREYQHRVIEALKLDKFKLDFDEYVRTYGIYASVQGYANQQSARFLSANQNTAKRLAKGRNVL